MSLSGEAVERNLRRGRIYERALRDMPPDIRESAERWKMSAFIQEVWCQAFVAGWYSAERKGGE